MNEWTKHETGAFNLKLDRIEAKMHKHSHTELSSVNALELFSKYIIDDIWFDMLFTDRLTKHYEVTQNAGIDLLPAPDENINANMMEFTKGGVTTLYLPNEYTREKLESKYDTTLLNALANAISQNIPTVFETKHLARYITQIGLYLTTQSQSDTTVIRLNGMDWLHTLPDFKTLISHLKVVNHQSDTDRPVCNTLFDSLEFTTPQILSEEDIRQCLTVTDLRNAAVKPRTAHAMKSAAFKLCAHHLITQNI